MNDRLLLYIDILGFSDLVAGDPSRVDDLYEVVASLTVHRHDAFKCIIFSDTILVYNLDGGDSPQDKQYLLMFMCEFAKDLMHRLTGRKIVYRAVITCGCFRHYQLNDVPCFYGAALIKAYEAEKNIKAIGVFMDRRLVAYSDIFETVPFNDEFNFVYITQSLNTVEMWELPCSASYVESTDLKWSAGPELLHIVDIISNTKASLPDSVLIKYQTTLNLYKQRYPRIVELLECSNLDISIMSPEVNWQDVIDRYPENCSYAIKKREDF